MKATISGRDLSVSGISLTKRQEPRAAESAEHTLLPVKSGRYIGNQYIERWGVFSSASHTREIK